MGQLGRLCAAGVLVSAMALACASGCASPQGGSRWFGSSALASSAEPAAPRYIGPDVIGAAFEEPAEGEHARRTLREVRAARRSSAGAAGGCFT